MLARKYNSDYYAWEEQKHADENVQQQVERRRADSSKVFRHRLAVLAAFVIAAYLISVVRSEAMVNYGNELVSMRQQEAELIRKNNELKIEVEQLKGPARIIGLAEQKLGMKVARNNIYVKAGN